jgi:hypothetical protein
MLGGSTIVVYLWSKLEALRASPFGAWCVNKVKRLASTGGRQWIPPRRGHLPTSAAPSRTALFILTGNRRLGAWAETTGSWLCHVGLLSLKVVSDPLTGPFIEAAPGGFLVGDFNNQQLVPGIDMPRKAVAELHRALLRAQKPSRIEVVPPQGNGFQGFMEAWIVLARPIEVVANEHRAHP